MKLNADQLYTLSAALLTRESSLVAYQLDAASQRELWKAERKSAQVFGDHDWTQEDWLLDVARSIDAIQPSATLYLLDPGVELKEHCFQVGRESGYERLTPDKILAMVKDHPRIVLYREHVAFYGNNECVIYFAGSSKYIPLSHGEWPPSAFALLLASLKKAEPRKLGTTERYKLAKAKYKPRRDFYYVPNVHYESSTKVEPQGGHHASPVAHDRSAHKALLTRVSVEPLEAEDLRIRGYTLAWTEELSPEVVAGMTRRGKEPTPGTLNAYRWVDKSASRVNAAGDQAQRVTVIR